MAWQAKDQARRHTGMRRTRAHTVTGLAGLCCALSLGIALAACGAGGAMAGTAGSLLRPGISLVPRMALANPTADVTPDATATNTPAATATATTAATATATTTAATATSATTATVAGTTTATTTGPGAVPTGDNGNFLAGVVLMATGALLLLLLIIGLTMYLLVWRRRGASGVLLERPGYSQPDSRPRDDYGYGGGYNDSGYNDGAGGYDEPTVPYDDGSHYGGPGDPGAPRGWSAPPRARGASGYSEPFQRGGGPSGSRGGDAWPPR